MEDFYCLVPNAQECAENQKYYPEEMDKDNYVSEDFVGHIVFYYLTLCLLKQELFQKTVNSEL